MAEKPEQQSPGTSGGNRRKLLSPHIRQPILLLIQL
jgi:hypothetical protein